jgi:hypothetical protein
MDLEKFERDVKSNYKRRTAKDLGKKVSGLVGHINSEWNIPPENLTLHELKLLCDTVLDAETKPLHDEVEELLAQKERIERQLERKSDELQQAKYLVFNAIESSLTSSSPQLLSKLHQIKLQSIDLFDMLEEMVESAIITTLEKGYNKEETIAEITKDITSETLSEGILSTVRIRKIITTILQSAIGVAEASPNSAEEILRGTLKGIRAGLIRSIDRFKQQLLYMPEEVKALVLQDYESIDELHHTELIFTQTIQTLAQQSDQTTRTLLTKASKDIRLDMDELIHISKETVEVMRDRFSHLAKEAVQRGSRALKSETAKEAKRMGIQAWGATKAAIDSALKNAKDAMEQQKKKK